MPRVGLLWRREWDPPGPAGVDVEICRLHGVFAAFSTLGATAEAVVYSDDRADAVREKVSGLDGLLVWVNPIEQGLDRSELDRVLREAAAAGVWVSAHPDVIARFATKRVLVDTAGIGWGSDTRLYGSPDELRAGLPARVATAPRVLKRERGMGGQGVWKVERHPDGLVVQDAGGDGSVEAIGLEAFVERCAPYFAGGGVVVEQPYLERVTDGMIRVYLVHERVVGFAHQYPRGLRPFDAGEPLPGKRFERADGERFRRLCGLVERTWVPEMQHVLGLERDDLPVIWDADFLYGPPDAGGEDTYVLCEINASSTFAFPEHAMPDVARAALARIAAR